MSQAFPAGNVSLRDKLALAGGNQFPRVPPPRSAGEQGVLRTQNKEIL